MNYWHQNITIRDISFSRFIGGPLDGITDSPFRKLVRQFSNDTLLYTEMRHVGSVANDQGKARTLLFDQEERLLSYQVSASDVQFIEEACRRICAAGVDIVDLNIGCPARNVIKSGSGSFLMSDLKHLEKILLEFRKCLSIPFTVKIRAGFKVKNACEVARLIESCGADALAIHPRLQTEFFNGLPDYNLAAEVKKNVKIPVFLSGGIINWNTAQLAYEKTGVDGYLIGRGLWSKPWKLYEMREHSQGRIFNLSNDIVRDCALQHLNNMIDYYGYHGLHAFRKHLPFYIKGKPIAALMRKKLMISDSVDEVKNGLLYFFELNNYEKTE